MFFARSHVAHVPREETYWIREGYTGAEYTWPGIMRVLADRAFRKAYVCQYF